jgi:hypothetical protein
MASFDELMHQRLGAAKKAAEDEAASELDTAIQQQQKTTVALPKLTGTIFRVCDRLRTEHFPKLRDNYFQGATFQPTQGGEQLIVPGSNGPTGELDVKFRIEEDGRLLVSIVATRLSAGSRHESFRHCERFAAEEDRAAEDKIVSWIEPNLVAGAVELIRRKPR